MSGRDLAGTRGVAACGSLAGRETRGALVASETRKAIAVFHTMLRHAWTGWPSLLVRAGFVVVLLLVFGSLWAAAYAGRGGASAGRTAADAVWYLAFTEVVVLSVPFVHLEIEGDVSSGAVETRLSRPHGYLLGRWAEGAATFVARVLVTTALAVPVAYLLAGRGPADGSATWLFPVVALLAGVCGIVWASVVGLTAFWLRETSPAYWVYQKGLMVFGAMLFPITIYPEWMQRISACTPFGDMVGGVGETALGTGAPDVLARCGRLVLWTVLGAFAARVVLARGTAAAGEGG